MEALDELLRRHFQHDLMDWSNDIPLSLTVSSDSVLAALRGFSKACSPVASQLRCQHLLYTIDQNTSLSAKNCLDSLIALFPFVWQSRCSYCPLVMWCTYNRTLLKARSKESCLTRCFPSLRSSWSWYSWRIGNDPDLCCLKVDFQNAFNEC
ncbi:uncharacterized protein LOC134189165 [Corticium candelabrum]|uniref:uncharacterized protein LOC134189165 n=1 Tax=Corticium candelabrum TaxID=121492 RepID=UPI002E26412B|nr:uncharacterized protein LOC134189165 [Corticium candelabrum]